MARKKTATKKKARSSRAVRGLAAVSTTVLQKEIERRRKALEGRRDRLVAELDSLDEQLAMLPGDAPGRSASRTRKKTAHRAGRRTRGGESLAGVLQKVLTNQTLSVTAMADAVKAAGYPSRSAHLRTMISQTLSRNDDVFKRVARGQYTVK
jgi:hypothetical protein